MERKLDQHLERNGLLPAKTSIIVAVSGGVDSVALLDMLSTLQASYGWDIAVAHLDHNIRANSSDDAELVGSLANKYGHKYYLAKLDGGETRESALRKARYDYLESIREGHGADWIATAHHRDDRIETSIFNTIRGADRYGMTAMRPVRGNIVRPLLPFRKGDLVAHAHAKALSFSEDVTNTDVGYTRNFVRHELLPHAAAFDPGFQEDYLARLDRLEKLSSNIESGLEQLLRYLDAGSSGDKLRLSRAGFAKLSGDVQLNLLVHTARQLCPGIGLSTANLTEAQSFLLTAKTGSHKVMAGALRLEREYSDLVISPEYVSAEADDQAASAQTLPLRSGDVQEFGRFALRLNDLSGDDLSQRPVHDETWLPAGHYYVRTWQKGDRIYPVGLKGSKKLSDIFVDRKVPRAQRSSWPVVINQSNEVVWVPGLAKDNRLTKEAGPGSQHVICEAL